jgi:hypothetical protein
VSQPGVTGAQGKGTTPGSQGQGHGVTQGSVKS